MSYHNYTMSVRSDLLADVEVFLASHPDMPQTKFGTLAVHDGGFVRRLREGGNITAKNIDRARQFMVDQRALVKPRTRRRTAAQAPAPEPAE